MNIREDTTTASSESSNRWHRPNLYVTIVGLYLLVLTSAMSLSIGYLGYLAYDESIHPEKYYCSGGGLCTSESFLFKATILVLALPIFFSLRGGRRLLKLRYNGFRDALILLIISTVPLAYYSIGLWHIRSLSDPSTNLLLVAMVLTSIMYGFLMAGRKSLQQHK